MKVKVKLFALLDKYLPAGSSGNACDLEVAEGATVLDVAGRLGLPARHCHLVLVNGVYLEPGRRGEEALAEGDVLAIWPPVAGG